MRLTENQLRRIIRSAINESWDTEEGMGSYEDDAQLELEIQKAYEDGSNAARMGCDPEDCPIDQWSDDYEELSEAWLDGFHSNHPDGIAMAEYQDSDAYRQKEMFRNARRR